VVGSATFSKAMLGSVKAPMAPVVNVEEKGWNALPAVSRRPVVT